MHKQAMMKLLLPPSSYASSCLHPRTTSHSEEEQEEWLCSNGWSDLPTDILCQVADRLPYWDLVRSAAVCRTWRLVIHGAHLPQRSTLQSLLVLYLMNYTCTTTGDDRNKHIEFLDLQGDTYKYKVEHPVLDLTIRTNMPPLPFASKYGWLLLNKSQVRMSCGMNQYFYLYNPSSHEVIELPGLATEILESVEFATFTTPPTSPDCAVFVLCTCRTYDVSCSIHKIADGRWTTYKTTRAYFGLAQGVTYVDGVFYCIFTQLIPVQRSPYYWSPGLAVFIETFDMALEEWVMNYTSILIEPIEDRYESRRSFYVVESIDGKLLLAVSDLAHDVARHYWFLYQFDRSRKEWTKVPSLGQQVLLLSSSSSIACATEGKDSKFSDMIFHLNWGEKPFTLSSEGIWRKPFLV